MFSGSVPDIDSEVYDMNICVFGDSIAKGVVYDEEKEKYVFSKNCFLDIISRNLGVTVKNFARFGSTTEKGEMILDKHLEEVSDYDYTLLEFGGNDCDLDWKAASENPDQPQTGQIGTEDFVDNYVRMINKVKEHGGRPLIMTLPPLEPHKFFEWVTKDLDKFNVMTFLKNDKTNIYRWQEEYSDLIFEIGDRTDTPVIDIRRAFLESSSYGDMISLDGMHPNEEGHKAIAGFLEDEWLDLAKRATNIISWSELLPLEFAC